MRTFTEKEIADQRTYVDFKRLMDEAVLYDDVVAAGHVVENFDGFFAANDDFVRKYPSFYRLYHDELARARWVVFGGLSDDDAVRLCSEWLPTGLRDPNISVREKVEQFLRKHLTIAARDELRGRLRKAILESDAELTESGIQTKNDLQGGTIQRWITEYNGFVGASSDPMDVVSKTRFYTQSKNFPKLTAKEQRVVRDLIELYEYLKLSSGTPEGFEDTVPVDNEEKKGVIKHGQFITLDMSALADIRTYLRTLQNDYGDAAHVEEQRTPARGAEKTPNRQSDVERRLSDAVQQNNGILQQVHVAEQRMLQFSGGDEKKLIDAFFTPGTANVFQRVGILYALARLRALDALFLDPRMTHYLINQVPRIFAGGNITSAGVEKDLAMHGITDVYKKEFFRAALRGAGMQENVAAMLFQQMMGMTSDAIRKELMTSSYFDVSQGAFHFRPSVWKDGSLVNA